LKKNRPSITAEGTALVRAFESKKPEGERICYDPYAHYFTSPLLTLLMNIFVVIGAMGYAEKKGPGGPGFIVARARYIDDYLKSCLKDSIEQLVIFGAGYDSRAYRFEELKRLKVFEIDHPVTQGVKIEKLKRIFGKLPENVIYVSIDFESETLKERLSESGYNRWLKTLFIWEGVTMYITAEAVDDTLAFIAKNSGKGSSIVFDYIYKSGISREARFNRLSKITGEREIFGIEEGTIEEFLRQRGFYQIVNANSESLKRIYFTEANQKRVISPVHAIVHAVVESRED
jgi:methyltransferase (TIGR00027 family)